MFVQFPACVGNWLIRVAARRRGFHDLRYTDSRSLAVVPCYTATDVTLGYDTDQFAGLVILDHGRASAS